MTENKTKDTLEESSVTTTEIQKPSKKGRRRRRLTAGW